jgi:hypothetical protein
LAAASSEYTGSAAALPAPAPIEHIRQKYTWELVVEQKKQLDDIGIVRDLVTCMIEFRQQKQERKRMVMHA